MDATKDRIIPTVNKFIYFFQDFLYSVYSTMKRIISGSWENYRKGGVDREGG
jgi:hypothetical protein